MRDSNGFLVTSTPVPDLQEANYGVKDSEILQNNYAYKPGLFALIKLGKQAAASAAKSGLNASTLNAALATANKWYAADSATDAQYCDAIRALRGAIRNQAGVPEAEHPLINRFPTDPLF